jgi:hypothetical protein
MIAHALTPILNVSSLEETFAWFGMWGWQKQWDWPTPREDGQPASFGAVRSGVCEIFLCRDAQGGRGRSTLTSTAEPLGNDASERGVWMSVWVEDVDAVHRLCVNHRLDVTMPPTDEPWCVREMHLRHPDGHVFRISRGIKAE